LALQFYISKKNLLGMYVISLEYSVTTLKAKKTGRNSRFKRLTSKISGRSEVLIK